MDSLKEKGEKVRNQKCQLRFSVTKKETYDSLALSMSFHEGKISSSNR
jgi:hypothetical protein